MGLSEHPLQQHRSGWPFGAMGPIFEYVHVAGDQKAQIPGPTLGVLFWGGST